MSWTESQPEPPDRVWAIMRVLMILAVIALLAALVWIIQSGQVQGADVVPQAQLFRDTVVTGDPDRDFQIVWCRGDYTKETSYGFFVTGDDIWAKVTLIDKTGRSFPVVPFVIREQDWYESCFYRSFQVPTSTPYGQYKISLNGQNVGTIDVSKGNKNTRTLSGRNNGPYVMTANTRHIGYGAFVFGDVTVAPGATLEGVTIVNGIVSGTFTNGILKDCRFVRCQVGGMVDWFKPQEYSDHGALYRDCVFDQTQVTGCCSGCFVNCTFTGRVIGWETNGHNFVNERAKRLCMFNCVFDKTDRGPILRTSWGDNSDGLYVGIHVLNVNSTTNGNEAVCIEGDKHRFDRNIFLGLRVDNTTNHAQIWNTPAVGNLFANGIHNGSTISFSGIEKQEWNECRFNRLSAAVLVNRDGNKAVNSRVWDNVLTKGVQQ